MRFGTGKDIITPTAPMNIACSGVFDKPFAWIHDDVSVRCLVLDDGREKAVLMAFDLLFHDHILNDQIAAYAHEKYGIKPDGVTLSYSHAHTAPAARGYNRDHHDDAYEELLLARAKACLDRAMCSMTEGTLEYTTFNADFNISRRGNANGVFGNIPDNTYPRDREFWVLCLRDLNRNIRSIVTNYACHPVFYPAKNAISAEFPGRLCQLLDTKYYGCTSLFFQSTAGDVRPRSTVDTKKMAEGDLWSWPWRQDTDFGDVHAMAQAMCDAVTSVIACGDFKNAELSIASDAFTLELPMEGRPLEYFAKKMQEMEKDADNPNRVNAFYIAQGGYGSLADSLPLHCQTIRLSDQLYLATVGGEPCFGVKNAIKKAFPEGKDICFIGYTDACAYIVDDRVLSEGGYEPTCHLEYCLKGPFQPGLDKRYEDAFAASLRRIEK